MSRPLYMSKSEPRAIEREREIAEGTPKGNLIFELISFCRRCRAETNLTHSEITWALNEAFKDWRDKEK